MFVKYNKANLHTVGHAAPGAAVASHVVFKPGLNQLSPEDWAKVKGHPHVKALLDEGDLEVVGKEADDADDLAKMDPKKATKMIKETMDHVVLVKWYESEERDVVKTAIAAQLEKLNMKPDGKPLVIDKK